jgi:Ran GTPase-activating protein (RanGAP) involved in mRNA processing and transport
MNGVEFDLVINEQKETAEEFRCKVCRKLAFDMILCGQCEAAFCKQCVNEDFCKKCGQPANSPNKLIMRILSKIKLKCRNEYCSEIVDYDEYHKHIKSCVPRIKSYENNTLMMKQLVKVESQSIYESCHKPKKKLKKAYLKENTDHIETNVDEMDIVEESIKFPEQSDLSALDFSCYNFSSDKEIQSISLNLEQFKQLKKLKLYGTKIYGEKVVSLSESFISISTLEVLDLEQVMLGDYELEVLCNNIQYLENIKELNLKFNNITWKGIAILSNKFRFINKLEVLNLGENPLTDRGIHELSKNLSFLTTLRCLYLDNTSFGETDSLTLYLSKSFNFLKNLEVLNLGFNNITSEGFKFFSQSFIYLKNLKELLLHHNEMKNKGIKYISKAFSSMPSLEVINLSFNKIDQEGAELLAENFRFLPKLKTFIFEGNNIGKGINNILNNISFLKNLKSLYIKPHNFDK